MNRRLGQDHHDPFSSYVKSCPPADGGCDQRFADGPPTGICAKNPGTLRSHPPARGARQGRFDGDVPADAGLRRG
jgi:hypothetical protein